MFGRQLESLDVPGSAQVTGIHQRQNADGSIEWTVTFRQPPPPLLAAAQSAGAPSSESGAPLVPPRPPPLPHAALEAHALADLNSPAPLDDSVLPPPAAAATAPLRKAPRENGSPSAISATAPGGGRPPRATTGSTIVPGAVAMSPLSPVPGPFPLLPFAPGTVNRLFPLRCTVKMYQVPPAAPHCHPAR